MRNLNWNKETGPKPSKAAIAAASVLVRQDTDDHIAVAMTLRPNGATQNEIITLLGKPHRNKIRELVTKKRVKRQVIPDSSRAVRIKLIKR